MTLNTKPVVIWILRIRHLENAYDVITPPQRPDLDEIWELDSK